MAEFELTPRSIFDAVGGCRVAAPGFAFDEAPARSLVSLARRRGDAGAALADNIAGAMGLTLPGPGAFSESKGVCAMFAGPDQWLISAGRAGLEAEVRAAAAGAGTVTEQSDAFVELTLSGPMAREVLARLSGLDYDDAAFPQGAAGRTVMQQIPVVIAREGREAWRLNTARSTARSFAHDVKVAAEAVAAREGR